MNLGKTWLILWREYTFNFTRPTFLLSAFGLPLILTAIGYISVYLIVQSEGDLSPFKQVGVVDEAEVVTENGGRFVEYPDAESARRALAERRLDALFILPPDYLATGAVQYTGAYGLNSALQEDFSLFLAGQLALRLPDPRLRPRLQDPYTLRLQRLGEAEAYEPTLAIARLFLPVALALLITFNGVMASQFLMSSVAEEKENRLLEILVTSCRPAELLLGKMLGLGGLALTPLLVWFILGLVFNRGTGGIDLGTLLASLSTFIALALVYALGLFFLLAGVMVAIGAASNAEQEARQAAAFFVLICILPPIYALNLIFSDPNHPIIVFLSLFPLTAPLTMTILVSLNEVALWQVGLSLGLLLGSNLLVLWAGARIFRLALLNTGKRPTLRQVWHWLWTGGA
jgi:ABC-2 type transport system permease protein